MFYIAVIAIPSSTHDFARHVHTNAHTRTHTCTARVHPLMSCPFTLFMIRWMFYIAVVVIPIVGAVLSSTPARHAVPKLVAALRWRRPNPHALRNLCLGAWTINAAEMVRLCKATACAQTSFASFESIFFLIPDGSMLPSKVPKCWWISISTVPCMRACTTIS
jgi:hypothetical protein